MTHADPSSRHGGAGTVAVTALLCLVRDLVTNNNAALVLVLVVVGVAATGYAPRDWSRPS